MKVLSKGLFIRTLGAALAAVLIATGLGAPLGVFAKEDAKTAAQKSAKDDYVYIEKLKYTVTDKALKNAKANINIKVNKKNLKNKGLNVKVKSGKKNVSVIYVPVKETAKAMGWKYVVKKNEMYISTGSRRAVFAKKRDGYTFVTELKGASGCTAPIGYGKPYDKNKVLYVPLSVFENLSSKCKAKKDFKKNTVTISIKKK